MTLFPGRSHSEVLVAETSAYEFFFWAGGSTIQGITGGDKLGVYMKSVLNSTSRPRPFDLHIALYIIHRSHSSFTKLFWETVPSGRMWNKMDRGWCMRHTCWTCWFASRWLLLSSSLSFQKACWWTRGPGVWATNLIFAFALPWKFSSQHPWL